MSRRLWQPDTLRAPLDEALDDEMRSLDLRLAGAWRILGAVGVIGGILVWKLLGFIEGPAVSALSAVGVVWFTAQLAWIRSAAGTPNAALPIRVGMYVETIIPSAFLVALALTRGPVDALGSYVPPMLYGCLIVAGIARLRPTSTIFFGLTNAVAFLLIYFGYLRAHVTAEDARRAFTSPGMQVTRAMSFAAGGALAFVVTQALRRAIGRAERNVRSHDLFGKYRLGPKIGAGGMGVVHQAVYCPEGGFERVVAVKLLHPHLADQAKFIAAFREEAELSARLVHPNIVQVMDFGRIGDSYFLAMEFVEGLTLGGLMKRIQRSKRPMDVDVAVWIALELLAGLSHSHAVARDGDGATLHVVHRDLCPANILVSASGEVKISDFGVAKALRDATFSETKTIAGHLGYMAPEQVNAQPIDERCDLFAVGIMLWELLTNESLFRRGSEGLTMMALLHHDVPAVASRRDGLSELWDGFFATALAPHRADRFESAADMGAALRRVHAVVAGHDALKDLVAWARTSSEEDLPEDTVVETVETALSPAAGPRGVG